ncbi:MAG: nuclease [Chloroflexi bacterium]|nr:MAG: nuclease [Chloroflexota bacterium]
MKEKLYHYRAVVQSVYDGDTCTVDIDLGLGTWVRGEKVRLHRINAPELRGSEREAGLRSRDFLRSQIDGKEVYIQTIKDRRGKYGRYIADIWLADEAGGWTNINDLMVTEGFAEYHEY